MDETRVALGEPRRPEPEPLQRRRLEVVDHDVRAARELARERIVAGSARSSAIERLLRFTDDEVGGGAVAVRAGSRSRVSSPAGDSTLITSAPRSPSVIAASGPASTRVKSATRMPFERRARAVIAGSAIAAP